MEDRASSRTSWIARSLILALIVINLLLLKQNFDIRQQLAGRQKAVNPPAASLKEGEAVPPIAGQGLDGQPGELAYKEDGRQHLLLFFSPNCTYCVRQASQWREVLNKIDRNRFDVLGVVSSREDRKAVFEHAEGSGYLNTRTPLPVLFVDDEVLARYKLLATPTTLLVSGEGKIEHVWVGKWDDAQANEVAAALN
jgi:peroxiredoxin